MPEIAERRWQERDYSVPESSRRGMGSYAAKLQAARERGTGTDPEQVLPYDLTLWNYLFR